MPNPGDSKAKKSIGHIAVCGRGRLAIITGSELVLDGAMIRRLWRGTDMGGRAWQSIDPVFLCKEDDGALLEVWPHA